MGQDKYYVGVAPWCLSDSYKAFVRDPCSSGRWIMTHHCVLFVACPSCKSDIYVPCVSSNETTRQLKTKNHGWVSVDYFPHLTTVCLQRRAKWRELRKTNCKITSRHRFNFETARLLALKADLD